MIKVWDYKKEYELLKDDILDAVDNVFKSGTLVFGPALDKFERNFTQYIGAKYALMVNSGSSANLLATCASCNPERKTIFKRNDEVLIPGICWSTSLWPLI